MHCIIKDKKLRRIVVDLALSLPNVRMDRSYYENKNCLISEAFTIENGEFITGTNLQHSVTSLEEFLEHLLNFNSIRIGDDEVIFTEDGIQVGCTKVDKDTIKKIYDKVFQS